MPKLSTCAAYEVHLRDYGNSDEEKNTLMAHKEITPTPQ